jgi:6,7-dimethyl-8-ribityllumazine synthase
MLKAIKKRRLRASNGRFVIVASLYNARYVNAMLRAAKAELKRARASQVQVIRVPGAFEIPIVAARLASSDYPSRMHPESFWDTHHACTPKAFGARFTHHASPPLSAIICLGVILRGETSHATHIGEAVTRAIMEIQLRYEVPVIHEVLLLENQDQARVRCLDRKHNRGTEAAQTALAMAQVMQNLHKPLASGFDK